MTEFIREPRYLVLKHKDLMALSDNDRAELIRIDGLVKAARTARGKPTLECVVIESTKPEYDQVWGLVEARLNPAQT